MKRTLPLIFTTIFSQSSNRTNSTKKVFSLHKTYQKDYHVFSLQNDTNSSEKCFNFHSFQRHEIRFHLAQSLMQNVNLDKTHHICTFLLFKMHFLSTCCSAKSSMLQNILASLHISGFFLKNLFSKNNRINRNSTTHSLVFPFQLQLQYTRELRAVAAARELGAREAMCSQLVEKVSVAGHCDVVYISELGCGINRGAMNFGRLYQVSFNLLCPEQTI